MDKTRPEPLTKEEFAVLKRIGYFPAKAPRQSKFNSDWCCWGTLRKFLAVLSLRMQAFRRLQKAVNDRHASQTP
jgi:hypothetical protein